MAITLTIQYGPHRTERGTVTVDLMDLGGHPHEVEVADLVARLLLSEGQPLARATSTPATSSSTTSPRAWG